jgi:hypothetical protein
MRTLLLAAILVVAGCSGLNIAGVQLVPPQPVQNPKSVQDFATNLQADWGRVVALVWAAEVNTKSSVGVQNLTAQWETQFKAQLDACVAGSDPLCMAQFAGGVQAALSQGLKTLKLGPAAQADLALIEAFAPGLTF